MRLLILLVSVISVVACGTGEESGSLGNSPTNVRVINERASAITVTMGDATFESVSAGETTSYQEAGINEDSFDIVVNGSVLTDLDSTTLFETFYSVTIGKGSNYQIVLDPS